MHNHYECSESENVKTSIDTALTEMFDIIYKRRMEIDFQCFE